MKILRPRSSRGKPTTANDSRDDGAAGHTTMLCALMFCVLVLPIGARTVPPPSMSAVTQDSQLGRYAAGKMRKARAAAPERKQPAASASPRPARTPRQRTAPPATARAPRRSSRLSPAAASRTRLLSDRLLYRPPLAAAAVEIETIFRCGVAGVRVILDDRYVGVTDASGYLVTRTTRGAHEATFARANYLTVVRRIEVTPGQNVFDINLVSAATTGSVIAGESND